MNKEQEIEKNDSYYINGVASRANQLGKNCRWLIAMMDEAHHYICKGRSGTWQMRMQQVVDAAKKIDKESRGSSTP